MATDNECEPSASTSVQWSQPCRDFELSEILLATENFDESLVIGHGGFGKVYRGIILNGSTYFHVAIKRLDSMSNQGAAEFWAEVEMLSKLRHCHLVSLFGYCNHGKEMILVYEYMPNGTLEDHLHKLGTPLSWIQRINICIGAAHGLHYLHTGTGIDSGVIHRDVKSSNILLHECWAAKISDFGLSRIAPTNQPLTYVNTVVKGTFGYFDPDYYSTGRLTRKSDVYAFGVVLLEVLCRKRAVDSSLDEEQWNLARWVQESIKEGNLKNIIDSDIRDEISPKCLKVFVRIAERCLLGNPKQRSTMAEVVVSLESVLTLQEKANSLMHPAGRTIFGRMVDKFPFPSNGEKSAQGNSKTSSNTKRSSTSKDNRVQILKEFKIPRLKEFMFDDLKRATSNFSEDEMLRRDHYGQVYYLGLVENDTLGPSMFLVKRFIKGSVEEWVREVDILVRLAHPNIISLLGYCSDNKPEHLLVYEYMQNGSFDDFLHGEAHDHSLSWVTRLTVLIGVACGLTYLHSLGFLHCGVKSSDILLDQDFNAKLWDSRIARVDESEIEKRDFTLSILGTFSYLDPAYLRTGFLSVKRDIYSFGVVLLEALTGSRPIVNKQPGGKQHLLTWAGPYLEEESKLQEIMDPRLKDKYPIEGAFECATLALSCAELDPKNRPSSEEVLRTLEQIYAVHK